MRVSVRKAVLLGMAALAVPAAALAQPDGVPESLLPAPMQSLPTQATPAAQPPLVQPMPVAPETVATMPQGPDKWLASDARQLLALVEGIGSEGLEPKDYDIPGLTAAIGKGEGPELDATADRIFGWLIEDLRDGRTPMEARKQWFVVDPDPDRMPTAKVMADALAAHDVGGVIAELAPTNPDYAVLREALAETPATSPRRIAMIQANMDRWRWLAHDLGDQYLLTNVPEFQLRLTVKDKIVRTYRTIVGKPGKTATPQLAETVEGVIFNPTWTVPQSIVQGEGLGAKVIGNPAWAKAAGYKGTKSANGVITVVQQPGPGNSLGMMKLDMPNEHAIYLHDTPSRGLFNSDMRALSHGCVRTERALELAITMAILGKGADKDQAVAISTSGKYTRVGLKKTFPVYITYFTMGRDINGELKTYNDIYGRDAPVLASFDAPRVANRARKTSEEVIQIVDDLQTS